MQSHTIFTIPHSRLLGYLTLAIYQLIESFMKTKMPWACNSFLTSLWTS